LPKIDLPFTIPNLISEANKFKVQMKTETFTAKLKIVSKPSINQLKGDASSRPSYDREKWWVECQVLLEQQGFKVNAKDRKAIEQIVY
jgi:hypothetical protein